MTGEVLPSYKVTFLIPALATMARPTAALPVKVTLATRGSDTSQSPTVPPGPTTRLMTPAGRPASLKIRQSAAAVSGVVEAGFSTTALPAANAGATLWATRLSGKLKGAMATTTPTGRRVKKPK